CHTPRSPARRSAAPGLWDEPGEPACRVQPQSALWGPILLWRECGFCQCSWRNSGGTLRLALALTLAVLPAWRYGWRRSPPTCEPSCSGGKWLKFGSKGLTLCCNSVARRGKPCHATDEQNSIFCGIIGPHHAKGTCLIAPVTTGRSR